MANYHEDNASFMIYKDWEELFESLENMEEAGELIMALFAFAKRGEIAEFRGALKMAFIVMSQQLERDGVKWETTCERRKAGGCKGGRPAKPKGSDENLKVIEETEKTLRFSEKPIGTDKDKVKEKDTVKDKVKDKVKEINGHSTAEQVEPVRAIVAKTADFERLWSLYPRKEGKKEAFAAFQRSVKKGTTVETMENGIKAYIKHIEACNIDRRYIKKGSTYFHQEAWNDVYDDSEPKKESYAGYDIDMFENFCISTKRNSESYDLNKFEGFANTFVIPEEK